MLRITAFILLFTPMLALAAAEVSRQPLPVMQSNPAMLRFLDPQPSTAKSIGDGRVQWLINQHYSSIFLADDLPVPNKYLADMELYIAEFGIRYGLSSRTDFELHLPVLRPLAGGLDSFLRPYHEALGLPNGGREMRPDNQFGYYFQDAQESWAGRARWEMGNIRMKAKQVLADNVLILSGSTGLALQLEAQLPTASKPRGWSHGGIDIGFGMVASWQSESLFSHLEGWWIHPFNSSDSGGRISDYIRTAWTGGYSFQWRELPLNLIAQVQGGTSPYQTGVAALDHPPWLFSFGLRTVSPAGLQWNFAFVENITQKSTQDFGITIGLSLPVN